MATALAQLGINVHLVVDDMDPRSPDEAIIDWAGRRGAVIVSRDQDFSAILAPRAAAVPSLINLRVSEIDPVRLASVIAGAITTFSDDLSAGAVLTLDDRRARVHRLPITRP